MRKLPPFPRCTHRVASLCSPSVFQPHTSRTDSRASARIRRDRFKEADVALTRGIETADVLNPAGLRPAPGAVPVRAVARSRFHCAADAAAPVPSTLTLIPPVVSRRRRCFVLQPSSCEAKTADVSRGARRCGDVRPDLAPSCIERLRVHCNHISLALLYFSWLILVLTVSPSAVAYRRRDGDSMRAGVC